MILHVISDDKFSDYAIAQFSGDETHSVFVLISYTDTIQFVSSIEQVECIQWKSECYYQLLQRLGNYKAIVLHGLFWPWDEDFLRVSPPSVKVAWVFWGGDIYGRADISRRFLTRRSKELLTLRNIGRWVRHKRLSERYEVPFDLLKRIDYCMTDIPEDYVFVKKYLGTPIKELWYNYYSIEETVGDLAGEIVDGTSILVGNSSTIECNHLDGFRKLSALPLGDSKVVVPLSYGESWLRSFLLKDGERRFGRRFQPLVEFIPRSEYNTIIKSCAVVVMPHYRPQAFGNILTALWLGSRVYLSEKSFLYPFFKRLSTVVLTMEKDLNKSNPLALLPLSKSEIEQNRRAISAVYSKAVMHQRNKEIVRELNQ